jgi:hypothetical protein
LEVEKIKKNDKGPAQTYVTALFDFGDNKTKSVRLHLTNLKPGMDPLTQQAPQISTQCDPPVAALGAITDASFEATTTTTTTTEQNDNSLEAINAMALALNTDEDSSIQVGTEVAQRAAEAVTAMHNATTVTSIITKRSTTTL